MYPSSFEYHAVGTVGDAVALLQRHPDEAKLLAGGHSLIPLMKLRFAQPRHLIDIRRIPGLNAVRQEGAELVVGALCTYRDLESSTLLQTRAPIVAEAASLVGDVQVRNMGTIGGSLAHADPASDMPAVVLGLGARLRLVGPAGEREVAADDFFLGLMSTALGPQEVLTELRFPAAARGSGGAYEKHPHPASGYALCGAAAVVSLDARGRVERIRVALTGVSSRAVRAAATEGALAGAVPAAETIRQAADRAPEGIELRRDAAGTEGYNAALVRVVTRRALERAVARAIA